MVLLMQEKKIKKKPKTIFGKIWYFIWEDNSVWSWLVNIVLAYLLIKFVVYPGLGFVLDTSRPLVAVMSGSMEHKITYDDVTKRLEMCGNVYSEKTSVNFGYYWEQCGSWYENRGITKEDFRRFSLRNGFNKGDMMVLRGIKPENLKIGDIIVFETLMPEPIIHRIINKTRTADGYILQTKGDHNEKQIIRAMYEFDETNVTANKIIGKAVIKLPFFGYVKIWFTNLINLFR